METKNRLKTGLIIVLVLCVLELLDLASSIITLINQGRTGGVILSVLGIFLSIIIIWYSFIGYKKPHGNTLRWAFLAFALYLGFHASVDLYLMKEFISGEVMLLAAIIIAYISGRLNKIEKNKKLLILVGLLVLADAVMYFINNHPTDLLECFGSVCSMVFLAALGLSYAARYDEHKEAGLHDK